jgi:hypothetical protein
VLTTYRTGFGVTVRSSAAITRAVEGSSPVSTTTTSWSLTMKSALPWIGSSNGFFHTNPWTASARVTISEDAISGGGGEGAFAVDDARGCGAATAKRSPRRGVSIGGADDDRARIVCRGETERCASLGPLIR